MSQAPERPSLGPHFAIYVLGQFDRAAAGVRADVRRAGAAAVRAAVEREIGTWPLRPGAAFTLEVAAILFEVDTTIAAAVLERACERLRRAEASEWERAWHRAAVALLEGPPLVHRTNWIGLTADWPGGRLGVGAGDVGRFGLVPHLSHVRARFARDPEFEFSWGLALEQKAHAWHALRGAVLEGRVNGPRFVFQKEAGRAVLEQPRDVNHQAMFGEVGVQLRDLTDAAAAFDLVRQASPDLRDLALLHLGHVRALRFEFDRALAAWDELEVSADRSIRYLAALLGSRVLARVDRPTEAIVSAAEAVEQMPSAPSALLMLAALRAAAGEDEAAANLVARALASPEDSVDPWWSYFRGHHAEWRPRLQVVRAGW
jgi:tetratricopeptide (TPR) repeat protein